MDSNRWDGNESCWMHEERCYSPGCLGLGLQLLAGWLAAPCTTRRSGSSSSSSSSGSNRVQVSVPFDTFTLTLTALLSLASLASLLLKPGATSVAVTELNLHLPDRREKKNRFAHAEWVGLRAESAPGCVLPCVPLLPPGNASQQPTRAKAKLDSAPDPSEIAIGSPI